MKEVFFELTMGDLSLTARTVPDLDADVLGAALRLVPMSGRAVQDSWSGEILRLRGFDWRSDALGETRLWFMYPGLIGIDIDSSELVICYGQGQLQDGRGPIGVVPLAEMVGDPEVLTDWGAVADSRGAVAADLRVLEDIPELEDKDADAEHIAVSLGSTQARARLLVDSAPWTCEAFRRRLPLEGTGTNTIFSGPLLRFWNPDGGPNGTTLLDERSGQYQGALPAHPAKRYRAGRGLTAAGEPTHMILYPGYIYYTPGPPWSGIRIATTVPSRMGHPLVPFARFVDDWSQLRSLSGTLQETGALPMSFSEER